MKVYEISTNDDFQVLVDDERSPAKDDIVFSMGKGKKLKTKWVIPKLRVYDPMEEVPNFYYYVSGAFVVDKKTCDLFLSIFEMAGELLPVNCTEFKGYLLNITQCVNCLDHDLCEYVKDKDTGDNLWLKKIVFQKSMIPESTLFKIPEAKTSIFTTEGMGIREEFKEMYEKHKMKGLKFELIWSDEKLSRSLSKKTSKPSKLKPGKTKKKNKKK